MTGVGVSVLPQVSPRRPRAVSRPGGARPDPSPRSPTGLSSGTGGRPTTGGVRGPRRASGGAAQVRTVI